MRQQLLSFLLAAACGLAIYGGVSAQSTTPQYSIRAEEHTSSMIRRRAAYGSVLPLNRTYAELNADEKAILHGWYESMPPGDEPPFPAAGLKPIYEALINGQDRFAAQGELFLIASVGADGKVTEVKAIGSPGAEMVQFAGAVLILTKFKPAVCSGRPCRMEFPLRQYFGRH